MAQTFRAYYPAVAFAATKNMAAILTATRPKSSRRGAWACRMPKPLP